MFKKRHFGKARINGTNQIKIDWSKASDHASFMQKNIPYLYFGVAVHKDYHKASDTFERIKPEFYIAAVESILTALNSLDGFISNDK